MTKVFVADSQGFLLSEIESTEQLNQFEFVKCTTVESFIDKIISSSPGVVLLDSDFGETLDLLAQIKVVDILSEVPVLYFSKEKIESSFMIELFQNGVHEVLQFPINKIELSCRLALLIKLDETTRERKNQIHKLNKLHKNFDHEHKSFKAILELIPLSVLAYDEDLSLVFVNRAAEMLTGYKFSQLQFKSPSKVGEILGFKEKINSVISYQGDGFCRDVFENRHKRVINIERKALELRDENGKLICHAEVFRDITTEIEFEQMMDARIEERSEGVVVTQNITMMSLASLAESRDNETGMHLERMRTYSQMIAEDLRRNKVFPEVNEQFVKDIYASSPLHDIGKVGIPDYVLLKPGKLSPEEWEIMKTHPMIGARTLEDAVKQGAHASFLIMARDICAGHHEKWDGSGYPRELKGDQIPVSARIVSLADCYDALRSARVYKRAFTHEESRDIILEKSGIFYDEKVVESFLRIEKKIIETAERFKDEAPTEPHGSNILDNR